MNDKKQFNNKLIYSAMLLAFAVVFPSFFGNIPQIGKKLCPIHFPILLCGLTCGSMYSVIIGLAAPFIRFALFGIPALYPNVIAMSVELATYGFVSGIISKRVTSKGIKGTLLSIIPAMLSGRTLWCIAMVLLCSFTSQHAVISTLLLTEFVYQLPGMALQLLIIPPIVSVINKSRNNTDKEILK